MNIHVIHTEAEHAAALKEIERLWDAKEGTQEFERLQVLSILVEDFERKQWPISRPNAIQAVLFRMDQLGLTRRQLEPLLGTRARVSEVLTGRRSLSLQMIRALNSKLGIPAEVLIAKPKRPSRKVRPRKKMVPRRSALGAKRAG
jgi:HTH-type transcriptional regulator/antitoxin HigA